jgi:D-arabinose 1-dehydrogenase-like Zn-dependent alcohol dehydrogenase
LLSGREEGYPGILGDLRRKKMNANEKLVVIGCGGVGGPASILAKKLMPDVDVTNIRAEKRFIVR